MPEQQPELPGFSALELLNETSKDSFSLGMDDYCPTVEDFRRAAAEEENPRERLTELRRSLPFAHPYSGPVIRSNS